MVIDCPAQILGEVVGLFAVLHPADHLTGHFVGLGQDRWERAGRDVDPRMPGTDQPSQLGAVQIVAAGDDDLHIGSFGVIGGQDPNAARRGRRGRRGRHLSGMADPEHSGCVAEYPIIDDVLDGHRTLSREAFQCHHTQHVVRERVVWRDDQCAVPRSVAQHAEPWCDHLDLQCESTDGYSEWSVLAAREGRSARPARLAARTADRPALDREPPAARRPNGWRPAQCRAARPLAVLRSTVGPPRLLVRGTGSAESGTWPVREGPRAVRAHDPVRPAQEAAAWGGRAALRRPRAGPMPYDEPRRQVRSVRDEPSARFRRVRPGQGVPPRHSFCPTQPVERQRGQVGGDDAGSVAAEREQHGIEP